MKFLFSRDLRDQPHIRLALVFFIIALLSFWGLNWPFEATTFGLSPSKAQLSVLGDPDSFAPAMSFDTLLLHIHVRLFLYTVSLLTVASIYFRLPIKPGRQIAVISTAYTAVLLNMLGVVGLRYISPHLAWAKTLGFWGFQLTFGWMLFQCLIFLLTPRKQKRHSSVSH